MTSLVRHVSSHNNSSAGYTQSIDCTGGNLLVVKIGFGGSSGITLTGAPTLGGTPLTNIYSVDGFQNHVHIYYVLNPPTGSQTVTFQGNSGTTESVVLELYADAGTPGAVVNAYKADVATSVSLNVTTGGASDLVSAYYLLGGVAGAGTPTSPLVDHVASAGAAYTHNAGTRAGTGGSDLVEYTNLSTAAAGRLAAFNIPNAAATTPGISTKTLERLGVGVSATAADVFVWSGHNVDTATTLADYKVLGATITASVLQQIDLSSTSIAVGGNITVVVIPATGGPGIAIETTAEDIA